MPTYQQKQIYHTQGNIVVPEIFKQWQANQQQYVVPVGTSYTEQSVHKIPQAMGHSYTTHHPPQSTIGVNQGTRFVSQSTYEQPSHFVTSSQSAYPPLVEVPYSVPYWYVQPQSYYQTQGYYQPQYFYQTQEQVRKKEENSNLL